jgi:hypothetical protein
MTVNVESDAEIGAAENLVIAGVMFMADPSAEGGRPLQKPAAKPPEPKKPQDGAKPAFQRVMSTFPAVPCRVTGQPEAKKPGSPKERQD